MTALEPVDEVGLSTPQVARAAGMTYRQLDYWTREGCVAPSIDAATGKGSSRLWSTSDLEALRRIVAVSRDLAAVEMSMPTGLVTRIWDAWHGVDDAGVSRDAEQVILELGATITITLRR